MSAPRAPNQAFIAAESTSTAEMIATKPSAWLSRNMRAPAAGSGASSVCPRRRPSNPPIASTTPAAASSGARIGSRPGATASTTGTSKLSDARLASIAAPTAGRSRKAFSRTRWPNPATAAVEDT